MKVPCILLVLATLSVVTNAQTSFFSSVKSLFTSVFGGYETPEYSVSKTTDDYERRFYKSTVWVCAEGTENSPTFMKLFRYIGGENVNKTRISMTVPVRMEYKETPAKIVEFYEMCFFLPEQYSANPPKPIGDGMKVKELGEMYLYARRFSGYASDEDWQSEYQALIGALKAAGETFADDKTFFAAGYNSPMQFYGRRNEIWIREIY